MFVVFASRYPELEAKLRQAVVDIQQAITNNQSSEKSTLFVDLTKLILQHTVSLILESVRLAPQLQANDWKDVGLLAFDVLWNELVRQRNFAAIPDWIEPTAKNLFYDLIRNLLSYSIDLIVSRLTAEKIS
jgi:hypothetical protein